MTAHQTKRAPDAQASLQLEDAIRASVTTAFRALPPAPTEEKPPAAKSAAPARK